jgi:hypothetical protein
MGIPLRSRVKHFHSRTTDSRRRFHGRVEAAARLSCLGQGAILADVRGWLRIAGKPQNANDKSKSGGQDRTRVNVNENYELRD